ncbi:MAG: ABC transporter substrate-binding protein, partial [Thermoflexales bacterium]|nr:ABC transporter substrate-binding protein [Thermoflexales bacterium]
MAVFNQSSLSRRQFLKLLGLSTSGALLAACAVPAPTPQQPQAQQQPTEPPSAPQPMVNSVGKRLPEDAAPPEQQVFVVAQVNNGQYMDISASVYNRSQLSDLFGIPLTRINKDFELVPGAAKAWRMSEDGNTWTFTLRDDIKWSDDTPLTADDFVATFRYMADPKSAYDFTWYY